MKKIILAFSLLIAAYGYCQVPGYQGKRLSVGYNASVFAFLQTFEGGLPSELRASYKSEFTADYVTSRKTELGLSYYFAVQKFEFPYEYENSYNYFYKPAEDYVPCRIDIFQFHIKFFAKNFIAPAGIYHEVGIGLIRYQLATPDNKLKLKPADSYAPGKPVIDGPIDPYSGIMLSYHVGKSIPVSHRFYMNTAVGINFLQGGDLPKIHGQHIPESEYILQNFNKEMRLHNFADIKIGFGFLAY